MNHGVKGTRAQHSDLSCDLSKYNVKKKKMPNRFQQVTMAFSQRLPRAFPSRWRGSLGLRCLHFALGGPLAGAFAQGLYEAPQPPSCTPLPSWGVRLWAGKEASGRRAQISRQGLGPSWGEVERRQCLRGWEGKHTLRKLCSSACTASRLACVCEVHTAMRKLWFHNYVS